MSISGMLYASQKNLPPDSPRRLRFLSGTHKSTDNSRNKIAETFNTMPTNIQDEKRLIKGLKHHSMGVSEEQ